MAKTRKGRSKSKGGKRAKSKRGKGKAKGNRIPLDVLENRLGKLSTIVAKRGGKLPKSFY